MSYENTGAVVLFSGGQDSAACLSIAIDTHPEVHTVGFNYGQRNVKELEAARKLSEIAGVKTHTELDLSVMVQATVSTLLTGDKVLNQPHELDEEKPAWLVPGRNHAFLSMAAMVAYKNKCHNIYIGSFGGSACPDNYPRTLEAIEFSLSLAFDFSFNIVAPFVHAGKKEVVESLNERGRLWWHEIAWSCFEGRDKPCGECVPCEHRKHGFAEAGLVDPLLEK